MVLRKTMVTWEKQLNESDLKESDYKEVQILLSENSGQMRKVLLLLGMESSKAEFDLADGDEKQDSILKYCD